MSLPDYYSRFNPDLLALIPPDAKVVLEIGCGAGALCEAYRRVNPGVEWIGVESNLEASQVAAQRGVEVVHRDAEDFIWFALPDFKKPPGLDCVVLGDVLEHLNDPWGLMITIAKNASPGAQVLASIPNVQHWTVIRDLLAGKWEYQDEGLLDRTHLRFFTLDSIRKMFDQAGLHIHEIRGRDLCNDEYKWFFDSLRQASYGGCSEAGESVLESLSIDPDEFKRRTRAYQYIVRAVKPLQTKDMFRGQSYTSVDVTGPAKLHIHAVTAEECCARPRIHEPFAAMRTVPGMRCTVSGEQYDGTYDILIRQRPRKVSLDITRSMIEGGSLLIAELDDEPEAIGVDPMALRAVHAVQVSTEPLAEIVRQYNPNVMVFPNQIAELRPLPEPILGNHDLVIVYAAQNRESDWAPIMDALNRVLEDHPLVQVNVIHDRAFYDALETTEKKFGLFCDYASYRTCLRSADIALLPLEPSRFNECKSDIKFLECAAEGVAVLASETVYGNVINDGNTHLGCIYKPPEYWEDGWLGILIKNAHFRRQNAEAAYAYVRDNRMLGQHFRKRLAWYQELLATKSDLTRQLLERVPELRSPQHALATTCP